MDFFSSNKASLQWARFLFLFLLCGLTLYSKKTYRDAVRTKLLEQNCFTLKKRYEAAWGLGISSTLSARQIGQV